MEMRTLGSTGVQVSPLCLGAMMFGAWGNSDHEESTRIIHRALDAGINFIDTADAYSGGESEEIVGRALAGGRRDGVVIATKVHFPMGDGPNRGGNSRRWIMQEVEASLRRLQTDWIDLYQIHRPDPSCDIDETLGALSDLVHAGKIRSFGHSTFPASQIVEAQWAAQRRGRERFVFEQPPYSMLVRGIEAEVLPVCAGYRMGVITWSPLAGGWLSGRWRKGQEAPESTRAERLPQRYDLSVPGNRRSSTSPNASPCWPTRPGSASSTWPSPSCSSTRRSPRPSSVPARWSSWNRSWGRPTSSSTTTCSTRSTTSCLPART